MQSIKHKLMKVTPLKCSFFGIILCAIILCSNLGLNHKSSLYNPWFHCYPHISKKKKKQKHTTNFLQIIYHAPIHFLKNNVYIKSTEIIAQPSFSRNRLICRRIYKSLNIITFARGWNFNFIITTSLLLFFRITMLFFF